MSNNDGDEVVGGESTEVVERGPVIFGRGEAASVVGDGQGDPGQPLEVGVPKVSINGMSLCVLLRVSHSICSRFFNGKSKRL